MKKLLVTAVIVMASLSTYAQADTYAELVRSALQTEKKAAVADVMELSAEEEQTFWPVYNEFQEKLYKENTKKLNLIKDFAENYDNMSAEKATALLKQNFGDRTSLLKLQKQYMKKFMKVLPPQKVIRYFQTENKIAALVDYELAESIPLL